VFAKLRKATISFVTSVRMAQFGSHSTGFMKFYICVFIENLLRYFKFH